MTCIRSCKPPRGLGGGRAGKCVKMEGWGFNIPYSPGQALRVKASISKAKILAFTRNAVSERLRYIGTCHVNVRYLPRLCSVVTHGTRSGGYSFTFDSVFFSKLIVGWTRFFVFPLAVVFCVLDCFKDNLPLRFDAVLSSKGAQNN